MSCAHAGVASAAPSSRAARISRRPPRLPGPGFGPTTGREEAGCAAAWHTPARARPNPRTTALPIPDHLAATLLSTMIHLQKQATAPLHRCLERARVALAAVLLWLRPTRHGLEYARHLARVQAVPDGAVAAHRTKQAPAGDRGTRAPGTHERHQRPAEQRGQATTGFDRGASRGRACPVPCRNIRRAPTRATARPAGATASPLRSRLGGCPRMRFSQTIIFKLLIHRCLFFANHDFSSSRTAS